MSDIQYAACPECAYVLANGIDDADSQDTDFTAIDSFLADHGLMAYVAEEDRPGYWDCEVCRMTQLGEAQIFEMVA